MTNLCILDIESKQLVDFDEPHKAGISCCGVWISWRGGPFGMPLVYDDGNSAHFGDLLNAADLVITWNGARYDMPVLDTLWGPLPEVDHCDLMRDCYEVLGWRPKLEYVAQATLGRGKSGRGDMAPDMYQRGAFGKLHSYCLLDVALTRDLYFFRETYGFLRTLDKAGKVHMIDFRPPPQARRVYRGDSIWHKASRVG